jgi:pimeloyl-ACP methyl ester carboxylesterase
MKEYMSKATFIFLFTLVSIQCIGQKIEYSLTTPNDTTRNYYITVFPKGTLKGSIILLPGFGELPKQTLRDWNFHKHASDAGYLTIIPALGDWSFFYIDDFSHDRLSGFIEEVFEKYSLSEESFFIGGFSFGGTMALQYAEKAYSQQSNLKRPVAVFAIDPPLDIERLYNCMTTTNRPKKNPVSVQEDDYITDRIRKEFKTDPKTSPEFFWTVSPYAQSDLNHTSINTLINVPIRIYNEPDIHWYIENRNIDFSCINSIDSSAMINWLRYLGNDRAELIWTSGKGYRISRNNMRHPHSWTIADARELIKWMKQYTGN